MTDDASAAVERLEDLKQTATMLRTWAPDVFPEVGADGQVHFGRAMMESAADAIETALVATGEPVYKAVERILDEESAWIARPSPEVTKRIALAATIAAFSAREDDPLYEAAERVWNSWAGGELTDAEMRELRDALGLVSAA